MTLDDLNDYMDARDQLEKMKELYARLLRRVDAGAQDMNGMPRSPGASDIIGDIAPLLADLRGSIEAQEAALAPRTRAVAIWIGGIANEYVRVIFRLRYMERLTWEDIATLAGGGNTGASIKNMCYRYIADGPPKKRGGHNKKTEDNRQK